MTTAMERGDERLIKALWESARETMEEDIEPLATTRVRKGGKDADRVTGNLVWFAVEHYDTRPTKEDNMPDWQRHLHFVVFNVTWDQAEREWKAVKFRPVMDLKKTFDRRFNLRFSKKVADLGYDIETKWNADGKGGRKYVTWDIKGIPASVVDKFSRRSKEVEEAEAKIIAERKKRDPSSPDHLSEVERDKLGATTRRHKRPDLSLDDLREYWNGRITPGEARQSAAVIDQARRGANPRPEPKAADAMDWAIRHHFETSSVVEFNQLAITAMERCMGTALPEDIGREAGRQGVLKEGAGATTREVLAEEERIIAFARAGRGCWRPIGPALRDGAADVSKLSDEQKAAVRHVWDSTDQVIVIRGGAGTGKTTMMRPAIDRLGVPAALLAPSADASRGQLREEGFHDANTVAAFLGDRKMQEKIKGGVIWVDEAGLLPIEDLGRLCDIAGEQQARLVLQGDSRQHKSVKRHGNMLVVLPEYAGLPVAELKEIRRQKGSYAKAVAAIRDRDFKKADAILRKLGWIIEGKGHDKLVEEYARAIEETKPNGERKTVLVIDPTHKDGDALSQKLRDLRKAKGLIDVEEKTFTRLVGIDMSQAQKGDAGSYSGEEVIQFFKNTGPFKAGQRAKVTEMLPHLSRLKTKHFAAYLEQTIRLAKGDAIRVTAGGWDASGKHRLDNGRLDEISGFTPVGDPILSNGWVMAKDFGHIRHGLVATSDSSQSKTFDIKLSALKRASLGAMGAAQAYVTLSRGRERGMIFTDLPKDELITALSRERRRKSAVELMGRRKADRRSARPRERMRRFMERVRTAWRQAGRRMAGAVKDSFKAREAAYER